MMEGKKRKYRQEIRKPSKVKKETSKDKTIEKKEMRKIKQHEEKTSQ